MTSRTTDHSSKNAEEQASFVPKRLDKATLDAAWEQGRQRAEKLRQSTAGMRNVVWAPMKPASHS